MKVWILNVLAGVAAVLAPIKMVMVAVGFLIMSDLITGIMAAKKRGEPISSARMRDVVTKMFVYQLAVVSAFFLGYYLLDGTIIIAKVTGAAIALVEMKSVAENVKTVTGVDLMEILKDKLGSKNRDQ